MKGGLAWISLDWTGLDLQAALSGFRFFVLLERRDNAHGVVGKKDGRHWQLGRCLWVLDGYNNCEPCSWWWLRTILVFMSCTFRAHVLSVFPFSHFSGPSLVRACPVLGPAESNIGSSRR